MRAPATYAALAQVLRELLADGGVKRTSDLTPAAISRWVLAHPERSPARVASLLRSLHPAVKYAIQVGYMKADPFEFRKPGRWVRPDSRPREPVRRHKSAAEIAAVLHRADYEAASGSWEAGRLQALVYTYAYTGMRRGEALTLEVADIDPARRTLQIRPKDGWRPKTLASSARIPVAEPLAEVLELWIPRAGCKWLFPGQRLRGPWTGGPPGQKALDCVRALGERAGVEKLSILSFRKSLGTLAKAWGLSALEVKALLRHTDVKTQEWYDEPDDDLMSQAVGKIRFPRIA